MGMYYECPYCNASLDFGERCDCQGLSNFGPQEKTTDTQEGEGGLEKLSFLVGLYVNIPTFAEITKAIVPAKEKLKRIIEREGDADGVRLELSYLAQLVAEKICSDRMEKKYFDEYNEKRRVAEANTPILI